MKKSKKEIFQDHLRAIDEDRGYAPKGFLQPIYNLVGCKVLIRSSTFAGKKGTEAVIDSVSQNYDDRLGRTALTLKFRSGSNLTLPIPSKVEVLESADVYISFERKDPNEDEANPYRRMRKNVKGYTLAEDDSFPEVIIRVIEPPENRV